MDRQIIKGWRGRLEDETAKARKRVWEAPASIVYVEGVEHQSWDSVAGKPRWFQRAYDDERTAANTELRELIDQRNRIKQAEMTEEDRERKREERRAKRAAMTEEEREREREWFRQWRAARSGSDEWRKDQAAQKRRRRAEKLELYKEIEQRSYQRNKEQKKTHLKEKRIANREEVLARERAYREANREHIRAAARAAYGRQKATKKATNPTDAE